MKDLSAYYEIARLITAELSETITPEEKERLNVWLAEDERHYMRYCRIRERLKRGEGGMYSGIRNVSGRIWKN